MTRLNTREYLIPDDQISLLASVVGKKMTSALCDYVRYSHGEFHTSSLSLHFAESGYLVMRCTCGWGGLDRQLEVWEMSVELSETPDVAAWDSERGMLLPPSDSLGMRPWFFVERVQIHSVFSSTADGRDLPFTDFGVEFVGENTRILVAGGFPGEDIVLAQQNDVIVHNLKGTRVRRIIS